LIALPSTYFKKGVKTMEKENKEWQKPELIVLVRNKPEEAVLATCKSAVSTATPLLATGCGWGGAFDCHAQAAS